MASPIIDQTIVSMTNATTVMDGAITYIQSVPKMVDDAIQKALANGATAAQLQPVSELSTTLQTKAQALQDALIANTPEENA